MRLISAVALACAWVAEAGAPSMTNLNPGTRPSARTGAGMAVVEGSSGPERFVLFGGNAGLNPNNQTWVYNVTTNAWTQMTPPSAPSSRAWGSLTWDPLHQRAVLFGGSRDLNGPLLNDVHLYDPTGNSWQALTAVDGGPSPRFLANMVYVPALQAHLVFAGGTATSSNAEATVLTNELWRLSVNPDAGTAAWTRLAPSGPAPPPRASACAGFDRTRGRLLVFGGEIVNDTIADLVEYDVMSDAWVSGAPVGGTAPTKRGSSVCTFDQRADKLVVYGGVSQPSGTPVSATFTFEPATRQWSSIAPMPSAGNNTFGAPVFSAQLGGMAFFGGRTSLIGTSQTTWWLRVNAAPVVSPLGSATAPEGAMDVRPPPSVTDADGDPLTYLWVQVSGPDAGLANAATATPTITTPRVLTVTPLGYSVLVSDGFDPPRDAGFTLVVQDSINEPPLADAGPDRVVDAGVMVVLDGRGSFDPNGEALSFAWNQTAGPAVMLGVIPPGSQAGFTAPAGPTTIHIELTVRDTRAGADARTVRITVRGADGGAGAVDGGAGGGTAGGSGGGAAGGMSGGSAGGMSGGAAGGTSGGTSGGMSGGSAGGAAGGSSGGAAGGSSGGVAGGAAGGASGGVAGGSSGGAAGGASGGAAGGASGGAAGGNAGGSSGGGSGGGTSGGGSAVDDAGLPDAGDADAGVDPRAGPPKSFGVGCGCDAGSGTAWWLMLALWSAFARFRRA